MRDTRIAVTSPSFSKNSRLRDSLSTLSANILFNDSGSTLHGAALKEFLDRYDPEVLIVGLERIDASILANLSNLRLISKYGVGIDNIDLDALRAKSIRLGWEAGVNRRSVSELVLCYALGYFRNVFQNMRNMRQGLWIKEGGSLVSTKIFGIVGFGNIGQDLASLLQRFGSTILYFDIEDRTQAAQKLNASFLPFEDLCRRSDVISFHVPRTEETIGYFGRDRIPLCKSHALIINTSRGDIVNFSDTASAVRDGRLGGFACDVFEVEPFDGSFFREPNIFLSSHIGGSADEAIEKMGQTAIDHVRHFLSGV